MTVAPIATIDLRKWQRGDKVRRELAAEVMRANEDIGFLVVTGHQVSSDLINEMRDVTLEFFRLPEDKKLKYQQPRPEVSRGYIPKYARALAYDDASGATPDTVEYFAAGRLDRKSNDVFYWENIWPKRPTQFREIWSRYYRALETLANTLLEVFAVALDLPPDRFAETCTDHCSVLFANLYPTSNAKAPGAVRLGEHTDYGSLTLLYRDECDGGLQVLLDDEWQDVPDLPGAYVVNIGDLMSRWTNDRWVSTKHRVMFPRSGQVEPRLSLPFFHQPAPSALIRCLETCANGLPPRYPPITSGENYLTKTRGSLRSGPSAADSNDHGSAKQIYDVRSRA
jgi:isopenicillin N synthase-like dioxygenase